MRKKEPLKREQAFFHAVSGRILALVSKDFNKKVVYHYREEDVERLNVVTDTDIKVNNIITDELQRRFPKDRVISEETYVSKTNLDRGRLWIIDPICGTLCFAKGITTFSTNIALATAGRVISACVIDHSQEQYIWSTGGNKVYINNRLFTFERTIPSLPIIELNLGALRYWNKETRGMYTKFLSRLIEETDFILMSQLASLSFAYVALDRVDAYVSPYHHIWDLPAINFLVEQAGGIVTELSGRPWTLASTNAVGARDRKLHQELLALLRT